MSVELDQVLQLYEEAVSYQSPAGDVFDPSTDYTAVYGGQGDRDMYFKATIGDLWANLGSKVNKGELTEEERLVVIKMLSEHKDVDVCGEMVRIFERYEREAKGLLQDTEEWTREKGVWLEIGEQVNALG